MYGNFDGIKDRAKLRKEVNDLRLTRLNKLKKISFRSIKKDVFLKVSKEKLQEVNKTIRKKIKREKHQQLLYNLSLITIVLSFFSFIIWRYIYPFLF